MENRLSKSKSVRFLLAVDTFPFTLSTTMICLLKPPSLTLGSGSGGGGCCSCSSKSSSAPTSSSPPAHSSQSPSFVFLFFFFFTCFVAAGGNAAALARFAFSMRKKANTWSSALVSSSSSSSGSRCSSCCGPFARSAVSFEILISILLSTFAAKGFGGGTCIGAGKNCGMSSSLGCTGPRREMPAPWDRARFARRSCSSCASCSCCLSSCSRNLRSFSSKAALRSVGWTPLNSRICMCGTSLTTCVAPPTGPRPIFASTASRCFCARVTSSREAIWLGTGGELPRLRLRPISIVRDDMPAAKKCNS
mmetsp:Transcript_13576/g.39104  ORF Transcript_13576/g.39104 Transcript_13576/m.39104 type:complete len:306 (+) Transcript_13576:350-1267(+)